MTVLNSVGGRQFFKLKRVTIGLFGIVAAYLGPDDALRAKRPDGKHKRVQVPPRAAVAPDMAVHIKQVTPEKRAIDLVVKPDAVVTHRNGCRGIEFLKNTLGKIHFGQPLVRGFLRCDTRKDTGHHIGKVLH